MTEKGIGLGVSDFKEVIKEELYFVDKSFFIKEVIDNNDKILLITRPRRFGKTLNMSMLFYFFDINGKYNKELFEGLNIMNYGDKYINEMTSYPVINLSFVDVKETSYKNMILSFKSVIADLYLKYEYLLDSDKLSSSEKKNIQEIINYKSNEVTLKRSLKDLSKYLEKHFR